MPTKLHAAGMIAESIIKPLAPKPKLGWKDRSEDLRSMPFFEVASAWLHKQSGFFVISSVEVPEPDTIGPEYHLSLSRRDGPLVIRVTSQEAQDILKDFDAEMFEEDNHISGSTRHFWRPVNQHLVGKECECKAEEPAIKEDNGDYVWRPLEEK